MKDSVILHSIHSCKLYKPTYAFTPRRAVVQDKTQTKTGTRRLSTNFECVDLQILQIQHVFAGEGRQGTGTVVCAFFLLATAYVDVLEGVWYTNGG